MNEFLFQLAVTMEADSQVIQASLPGLVMKNFPDLNPIIEFVTCIVSIEAG